MAEKVKKIEKVVPRIFRRNALDLLFFGFMLGVKDTLHTVTIEMAIDMFMEKMSLTDEDFNRKTARVTYTRMLKEYLYVDTDKQA